MDRGPYPYVPTFWNDGSGFFGERMTLSTFSAAIASSLITILLSVTLACLGELLNIIIYVSFLHKRRESFLDDQVCVLASNASSTAGLLTSLLSLAFAFRRKVARSSTFNSFIGLTLFLFSVRGASIIGTGKLFSDGPVPLAKGTCGVPQLPPRLNTTDLSHLAIQQQEDIRHQLPLIQTAALRFNGCIDNGSNITCPGPIAPFSWEVFENGSYCWFGSQNCLKGSSPSTIMQRATITPKDLGTTRKSRLALTFVSECSHVDTTPFKTVNTSHAFENGSSLFASYNFGPASTYSGFPPEMQNTSFIVFANDAVALSYKFQILSSLGPKYDSFWRPLPFLTAKLNTPTNLDNINGTQQLTLLINRIVGTQSITANNDLFFLTEQTPDPINDFYRPVHNIAALACRDQLRIHLRPTDNQPQGYTDDDVIAVGMYNDIADEFYSYIDRLDASLASQLVDDFVLFEAFLKWTASSTFYITEYLGQNAIRAASTLATGGIQFGTNATVTTRAEVTRWFGSLIFFYLYLAQVATSGADNNWGFGIKPLPATQGQMHWVCSSTLISSASFTSLNLNAVVILLLSSILIIASTYAAVPILWRFSSLNHVEKGNPVSPQKKPAQEAVLALCLHQVLQLHRIAVEKTYKTRFQNTTGTVPIPETGRIVPIYGVSRGCDLLGDENEMHPQLQTEVGEVEEAECRRIQNASSGESVRLIETKLYATMVGSSVDESIA
jgi:hypothetical protein